MFLVLEQVMQTVLMQIMNVLHNMVCMKVSHLVLYCEALMVVHGLLYEQITHLLLKQHEH
jgi:hypothetical protein